ncbi:hypothetical protein FRD01_02075 [Microvenator marinus]|uniref:Uncharacterized protein n=1 Tax=Microvenator marinus TaxID=2600177 RepID=A0A5B8XQT6_9DELT|nr:hypothetical protein [Microvenator marinus]QED26066.1 hypothetical protein FRD01_02075 [Microvenator marinus]
MFTRTQRLTAIVALAAFTQTACYNTYFITKSELEKLESSVEPKETVEVFGDCPGVAVLDSERPAFAQAEGEAPAEAGADAQAEVATDAPADAQEAVAEEMETAGEAPSSYDGCTTVQVSTANALFIKTNDGRMNRVTPFNFIMSQGQIVSPEYDLLERLDDVEGAEVDQFSTWKTVGTIAGVSILAIGTFVGISLIAPESDGFSR